MKTVLSVVAAAFILLGCDHICPPPEPVDAGPPAVCIGPPYSRGYGPFGTWATPDCTGDYARGVEYQGQPCALMAPQGATEGNVFCLDSGSPVDTIYFRDPNDVDPVTGIGVCKPWTLTNEPWYMWRFCGVDLVPLR